MTQKESIKLIIRKVLYNTANSILSLIPKKRGLVLFTSWFGQKYLDNTKYVYEYFLEHLEYRPVWMTRNNFVYEELKREGKPVEYFNSLKGRLLLIRAQAVFSTVQFSDYNSWLLSRCLIVDLNHGHPIKDPGDVGNEDTYVRGVYKMLANRNHFYSIVAGSKTKKEYNVVPIPQNHIIISDFARNDVFIDRSLQSGKNSEVESFKKGRTAIVYMPTHRSDGKVPMKINDILDLEAIESYCEKNNTVFIIKKHFYHRNEKENLEKYAHILDLTDVDDIDPQVLLCQADLLISDYSACYIDYMLLKRPIIFFQYDLEEYNNSERKLYYDFRELDIAPIVYEKSNLVECIDNLFKDGDKWLNHRMKFAQENYFDNINQKDGRAKVKTIFDQLYKQYYK